MGYMSRFCYISQPSKPGNKACLSFNQGTCNNNASHPLDLYVCAFCLCTVHKLCKYPKVLCKRKEGELKRGV